MNQLLIKPSQNVVPARYRSLITEMYEVFVSIFENELSSIYITGSWTRGEMRSYSDADFVGILKTTPTKDQLCKFTTAVARSSEKWSKLGLSKVDAKLLDLSLPEDYITILRRSVIEHDGVLIYGDKLENGIYEEYTRQEIASCFVRFFMEFINRLELYDQRFTNRVSPPRRAFAKLVLRSMEWVAIIRGAEITGRINACPIDVKKFAPELNEDLAFCWPLYESGKISDKDLNKLLECFCNSLDLLEKEGVIVNKELLETVVNKIKK